MLPMAGMHSVGGFVMMYHLRLQELGILDSQAAVDAHHLTGLNTTAHGERLDVLWNSPALLIEMLQCGLLDSNQPSLRAARRLTPAVCVLPATAPPHSLTPPPLPLCRCVLLAVCVPAYMGRSIRRKRRMQICRTCSATPSPPSGKPRHSPAQASPCEAASGQYIARLSNRVLTGDIIGGGLRRRVPATAAAAAAAGGDARGSACANNVRAAARRRRRRQRRDGHHSGCGSGRTDARPQKVGGRIGDGISSAASSASSAAGRTLAPAQGVVQ